MIIWMRRQSSRLQTTLEAGVVEASAGKGSRWALFWLAFLAVGREGFELVLFLTAVQMTSNPFQTVLGAILGLAAAAVTGWMLFSSSKRMRLRPFFDGTNLLLILFAAGLLAHGVHEFNEAGIIPPLIEHVWDFNSILDEKQPLGQILTAVFGYNGNPSLTETLIYAGYLIGAWWLWKKLASVPTLRPSGAPPREAVES
jgi:high-affinity iron transporter